MNEIFLCAAVWSTMLTGVSLVKAADFRVERQRPEFRPGVTVAETYCEYAVNPLGIDVVQPRFTWVLACDRRGTMQQSYHVLVASSSEKLAADTGDLWDSGQVHSNESVNVAYQGAKLSSRQECFWKVRVWDNQERVSPWSEPATFEIGLLEPADWHGRWIGLAGPNAVAVSPVLRKEFVASGEVKRARLYAAGVGWSEYYLNGRRVGDHVLDPAATDYDKRILYVTHDVTRLIRRGRNALGAMLGNGWYSQPPLDPKGARPGYGDSPCLLLELVVELADGTIQRVVSDESWRSSTGPIVKNSIWRGEVYDARLEKPGWRQPGYDDSGWAAAAPRTSPGGRIEAQMIEPIKVNKVLRASKLTTPKPGVYVYDFGQLFGGWARLRVKGPAGTRVALRYAERVFADTGLADKRRHFGPDGATDFYILKGDPDGERYEPRFTLHPVRYVQVEGLPEAPALGDLEGCVVHNSVDMTGDFECSNALLNQIHRNCAWTLTNGLYSYTLDCLYREYWGWLEPASNPSTLFTRRYMPRFWTKWLRDVQVVQHADGVVPDVVPAYPLKGRKTGDPAWAGNYPLVVWYVYQDFGDRRLLASHYPNMKRWVDHLTSIAKDNLIEKGGYYGDHMLPGDSPGMEQFISKETPPGLLWTGYYYNNVWILAQAAKILGINEDAAAYARLAEAIQSALNAKWLDASRNGYATGSQTANIFALALGVVPEANRQGVLDSLTTDILVKRHGHLHTGNLGTTCIMDALAGLGRGDVLYRVATATDYPGWGYMVHQGATTIWECWGGLHPGLPENARNGVVVNEDSMMMFASIEEFFHGDLAGIQGPDYFGTRAVTPGFRQVQIRPRVLGDLTSATAHVRTVRGIVGVGWKRDASSLSLKAIIPVNTLAKISIPKAGLRNVAVEEDGTPLWETGVYRGGVSGITAGTEEAEYVTFDTGSGTYCFLLRGEQ
ncbi:MAG: family 78 glycoside hydrolase catalytic domain [Phycisphaerae bacterium]|nr:family 78 glycoside hydrolase catalytic domain [Phycisphaerae bacterium]